jgi:hypothetical protein
MNKQELFEQIEELLDEYLLAAEMQETIPEETEEELQEDSDGEMQEESDEEILKRIRN